MDKMNLAKKKVSEVTRRLFNMTMIFRGFIIHHGFITHESMNQASHS